MKRILLLATLYAAGLSVHGQVLVEDFSYGTSTSTLPAASANWSYTGTTVSGTADDPIYTPTGLTFSGYASSGIGGAVQLTSAAGRDDIERQLGTTYTSGDVYVAFLLNISDATANAAGDYFFNLRDNTSPNSFLNARIYAREVASTSTYNLQITRTGQSATFSGFTTAAFNYNQTYLIVLKYSFVAGANNDPLVAWVLSSVPATEAAAGAATISAPVSGSGAADINEIVRVNLRQGANASNGLGVNATIDGIRVGTTWATVVSATPTPTITVDASGLSTFVAAVNTISPEQTYTLQGINLTAGITVTAPTNFQVSLTTGSGFGSSVVAPQSSGSVSTTVYVRLNPGSTAGPYSGNLVHSSTGATDVNVPVSGQNQAVTGIAAVRSGQPGNFGSVVTVTGRVTSTEFNPSQIVIQDNSGPGGAPRALSVFVGDANEADNTDRNYFRSLDIAVGDSVQIQGPVGEFQGFPEDGPTTGVLQISGTPGGTVIATKIADATTLSPLQPFVTTLAGLNEDLESVLVRINNVTFSQAAADNFAPGKFRGETTYRITDGVTSNFQLRCDITTDITSWEVIPSGYLFFRATDIPTAAFSLVGIAGQFSSDRQITPRSRADVGNPNFNNYISQSGVQSSDPAYLKIGTWNLLWFGSSDEDQNGRESTQAEKTQYVATIIDSLRIDVLGVQEVVTDASFAALITALNTRAGSSGRTYTGTIFKRSQSLQDVGFIWRTDRVSNTSFTNLTSANGFSASWASGRYPVRLDFDFGNDRITALCVHLNAGDAIGDYNDRVASVNNLKAYATSGALATANVILMGDFNDLTEGTITSGQTVSPMQPLTGDDVNFIGLTESFLSLGVPTNLTSSRNSAIDHIWLSNEFVNNTVSASTYPFYGEQLDNYRTTTSDHYPVVSYLNLGVATPNDAAIAGQGTSLRISPNPARRQEAALLVTAPVADVAHAAIYDATGRYSGLLFSSQAVTEGENRLPIDATNLQPGLYLVRLQLDRSGVQLFARLVVVE